MTGYRSPDEDRATCARDTRIRAVLDQAHHDTVSLLAAITLGEPATVVEQWVDRLYDNLRDNLHDLPCRRGRLEQEDRLRAIVLLLCDQAAADTDQLLHPGGNPT